MALNADSLSITSVFNSIVRFFRSQENSSKLRDLSPGSEASFLIRFFSNIFSAISYRIVAQSRENYLSTAALTSSNTGIAVNLGYSVYRGSNLKRKVRFVPNGDYVFPKFSIIGNYNTDYNIITLDEVTLEQGEETEFNVVVGKIKEETLTAGTSAIKVFSFFTSGISEDYSLFLGSTEVPTTKVIKELTEDKYLVRTNPYSSVDIIYLNTYPNFLYKYGTDSEITIRYVELADVPVIPFTADMLSTYGTLKDYATISTYIPFESVEEIKVNAPLHHELQNLIRSKADYASRISEIVPSVTEAAFEPLTPTYTLVSYLKNDLTLLTKSEMQGVNEVLVKENFFGTPLPDITAPRRAVAKLQISVALKNKYKNISDVQLDIDNIIANYYDETLGLTFSVYDLERQIEGLSYVKYARVSHALNDRVANTNYQLGYMLYADNDYYMVSQILGSSGTTEPAWSVPGNSIKVIDTGLETTDGSLVWRAYKKLPNMPSEKYSEWQPNTQYGIGEYVFSSRYSNYMFKCVDLSKNTGSLAPDLTAVKKGDFIVDGGIVWVVKDYSSDAPVWTSYTNVRLGESRNVTSSSSDFTLECISYTGTVGTVSDLSFEQDEYQIVGSTSTSFTVAGNKKDYFNEGDVIIAVHKGGTASFSVLNSAYNALSNTTVINVYQMVDTTLGYTTIFTEEKGTKDGQILWKRVEDINTVTYDWNMYMTFDYDLDIIGNE